MQDSSLLDEISSFGPGAQPSSTFEELVAPYRRELLAHGYQMLGSVHDAEDAVQETLTRAWLAWDRYDPSRASVRTWVHAIVTNTCLNALASRRRRVLPSGLGTASGDVEHSLAPAMEIPWVQPIPTAMLGGADDPAAVMVERGRVRLAFIVALQTLSPRQRAVLVLRDVLQFSAAEVASALETTTVAVNSALRRARRSLAHHGPVEDLVGEKVELDEAADVLRRYTDAFTRADIDALRAILVTDAVLEMPPVPLWYQGRDHVAAFMDRVYRMRGAQWRVLHLSANGQPAFAAYALTDTGYRAHSIQVLTTTSDAVTHNVVFVDPTVLALFDLPELPPDR